MTGGAEVKDNLETSIPGIFSCGNVLHVHDLVDYVSEEAARAGKNAADYVKRTEKPETHIIKLKGESGVRYTVPQEINFANMDYSVIVRFRVGDVYRDCAIVTYLDDTEIARRKRPVMAPGEMEQIILKKEQIADHSIQKIRIAIEPNA